MKDFHEFYLYVQNIYETQLISSWPEVSIKLEDYEAELDVNLISNFNRNGGVHSTCTGPPIQLVSCDKNACETVTGREATRMLIKDEGNGSVQSLSIEPIETGTRAMVIDVDASSTSSTSSTSEEYGSIGGNRSDDDESTNDGDLWQSTVKTAPRADREPKRYNSAHVALHHCTINRS